MSDKTNTGLYFGVAAAGAAVLILSTSKTERSPVSQDSGVPSKFIEKYLSDAQAAEQATNVPALVTLAQAGLESAWGKSAYGNNFFGVKADKNWTGAVQYLGAWEFGKTGSASKDRIIDQVIKIYSPGETGNPFGSKGYAYRVLAKFRKYLSARDGFIDHAMFLVNNSRYKKAFEYKEPPPFAREVAAAGYATDPDYSSRLLRVVDQVQQLA